MKIAIIASGLEHVARGVETWARDVAYALREQGVDVTLYKGSGAARSDIERTVSCVPCTSKLGKMLGKLCGRFMWRFWLGSAVQIQETTFARNFLPIVLREQFDIIHMQDAGVALFFSRLRRAGKIRSRVILGHGTEEPFAFLNKIDVIQHLAPFHLEEARAHGVTGADQVVVPNFVDVEKFVPGNGAVLRHELGIPEDAFCVVSVAAVKRMHKRIDHLLREVAALSLRTDKDVYLVIAGASNNETDELLTLGRKLLGDKVKFLLDLEHSKMADIHRIAHVFALCSLKEMMPIALLEALATGTPVLVSEHPVVAWMAGDGGDTVDMSAEGALAAACEKYFDDTYRAEKARLARERAVATFSKQAVIGEIMEMYERVL